MSQLLILKAGSEYLRCTQDGFELCPLNKASVFPLREVAEAKQCCRESVAQGIATTLMKLTIIEEPFTE
jgi:hypothetical protein